MIVHSERISSTSNITNTYNLNKLQKGVYLVKITDGDTFMIQKLIIK